MKNFGFIAVVALLMMFGCAKDEVITDEQELFSVEKNNQPLIGEKRGDGSVNGWVFVEFYGTSTLGPDAPLIICLPDSMGLPGMACGRKLLANGYFSGKLLGYGKINSSLSTYTIKFRDTVWEEWPLYQNADHYALYENDTILTSRFEKYLYNLEINGIVALNANDYFTITTTSVLRPMVPDATGDVIKGSWFFSSEVVFKGQGKLANYSDEYFRCGTRQIDGTNFSGVNLETGEMSLRVNNIHF